MWQKIPLLCLFLLCSNISGQELQDVHFNHLTFCLEYQDLNALRASSYVNDTLGVFETRTSPSDSLKPPAKSFLYGTSNYLELVGIPGNDPSLGFLTIVFSVDKAEGIRELKSYLDKYYQTSTRTMDRNLDGHDVPWYESLAVIDTSIIDSAFMAQAHFWFWIMGYKAEYFKYRGYTIDNGKLTRENYLEEYSLERKNKTIKRFSGIVMKLNPDEKNYISRFFEIIDYERISENEYLSPEKFRFRIVERESGDQNSLESIEFETSVDFLNKTAVRISDHISVYIHGKKGQIVFN